MESTNSTLTLTKDLVHQQHHLKEAVSLAMKEDDDIFIVSKDNKILACHSSLLVLFSPLIARLLSNAPYYPSPTIFLPDFNELHIKKLLLLLVSGQAIPGQNVNIDIKIINEIAETLQISMTDINIEPYLVDHRKVSHHYNVKKETGGVKDNKETENLIEKQNAKLVKYDKMDECRSESCIKEEEINIKEEEINIKEEEINIKEEEINIKEEEINIKIEACSIIENDATEAHCSEKTGGYSMEPAACTSEDESELKEHKHIPTPEKPYLCVYCQKRFTKSSVLKMHTRIHTGEKPFQCELCPKSFTQSSTLKHHTMMHAGEKPFSCEFCPKKFLRNSHLKEHIRIHTGDRPYECRVCHKRFTQSSHLKGHKKCSVSD